MYLFYVSLFLVLFMCLYLATYLYMMYTVVLPVSFVLKIYNIDVSKFGATAIQWRGFSITNHSNRALKGKGVAVRPLDYLPSSFYKHPFGLARSAKLRRNRRVRLITFGWGSSVDLFPAPTSPSSRVNQGATGCRAGDDYLGLYPTEPLLHRESSTRITAPARLSPQY